LDWILDKIRTLLNEPIHIRPTIIGNSRVYSGAYMSFAREDLTYFVMPRQKLHPRELSQLKQRVGGWLLKRTDIFAALQVTGTQWHHTMYFLLLAFFPVSKSILICSGFHRDSKWERRIQNPNQSVLISAACVPLRSDDAPEEEIAKILVFDQKSMRRTAWSHIWIPYHQIGLQGPDPEEPEYPPDPEEPPKPEDEEMENGEDNKAKEAKEEHNGIDNAVNDPRWEEFLRSNAISTERVEEDADWGLHRRGLKVWLRRTFIFQLMSLSDR
jgi:hypothetical protein